MLKKSKKALNRNRDFRCTTHDAAEETNMGLRSAQDEDGIVHHNKKNVEQLLMNYSRFFFSKVKELKVHKDKKHVNVIDDTTREKMLRT